MVLFWAGLLMLVSTMDAPPGYIRWMEGIPGHAEGRLYSEFAQPVSIQLGRREVALLVEVLGPATTMSAVDGDPARSGYVFGREDRPLIGFAIWLRSDGTAFTYGWEAEPRFPHVREIKQAWLAPGIVSWLQALTAFE